MVKVSQRSQLLLGLVLLYTQCAASASSRGEVKSLPAYGKPPTRHFTGFVEVDKASDTNLFYYYVESASAPATDPLVWWFNGGPGASSLAGLFSENGPLLLNEANKLTPNPYSWNAKANTLYVEFGAGIGYSYCANSTRTDPTQGCTQDSDTCSPCLSSDSTVAVNNVRFLAGFLQLFPELKGRPLYLTGESYAGVYGPTLALAILEHFGGTDVANLHGIWVTDPCMDNKAQSGWLDLGPDFLFQSGLIDAPIHAALTADGSPCVAGRTPVGDRVRGVGTAACRRAWRLYDMAVAGVGDAVHAAEIPFLPMYIDPLNAIGPSGGPDLPAYLASLRPHLPGANASKNAVYHIELGNNGYTGYENEYAACNDHPDPARDPLAARSMLDVYRALANHSRAGLPSAANFRRVIVSSGDVDPVVSLHGTEAAVRAIGFAPATDAGARLPWFYNASATPAAALLAKPAAWGRELRPMGLGAQVAGYTASYDTGTGGRMAFDFLTFKDSGHMVPAYAPQRSAHVLRRLMRDPADPAAAFAPPLPAGWADASDEDFYARTGPKATQGGGIFAAWAKRAMGAPFVCPLSTTGDEQC
eukprot:g6904.t1